MTLVDRFGRKATGLRMALTARCNLRCIYCHHEGESKAGSEISCQLASSIAKAGAALGMKAIKLTGGEPLMRQDLEEIISSMPPKLDLSMTTNGIFLAKWAGRLAESGLNRVNISLDTLNSATYGYITGCKEGDLDRVLKGIAASQDAGLEPIKLNAVVLKINQNEIWDLIEYSRNRGLILQLIELVDPKGAGISGDINGIERLLQEKADRITTREMHRRKKYFLEGAEIEVVKPMDNTEFCANCTRLRVTSDGRLKPCLLRSDNLVEVGSCNCEEIKELLKTANERREPFFKRPAI